jgi:3D (Asp-Asp-Asp) domain-containing protein
MTVRFPNSFERGYHDITITAYDDVGNRGSANITINLNAEEAPISIHIQSIEPAAPITTASFPLTITIDAAEAIGAKKIDLYLQRTDNSTELIGSDISPQQTTLKIQWTTIPPPGLYTLVPILTDANDLTHLGDPMMVSVLP